MKSTLSLSRVLSSTSKMRLAFRSRPPSSALAMRCRDRRLRRPLSPCRVPAPTPSSKLLVMIPLENHSAKSLIPHSSSPVQARLRVLVLMTASIERRRVLTRRGALVPRAETTRRELRGELRISLLLIRTILIIALPRTRAPTGSSALQSAPA